MPTPGSGEKTMSSRLLTMKFMQRAAGSPQSPSQDRANGPPSKRVRLSNGTSSPGNLPPALQDALDAEEQQRVKALEKHAEAVGETRWVLSIEEKPQTTQKGELNVVTAGFGYIDAPDWDENANQVHEGSDDAEGRVDDLDGAPVTGRRVFGKMKKRSSLGQAGPQDSESNTSSSESGEDNDEDDPAARLIRDERRAAAAEAREKRRAQRKEKHAESNRMASERRKKEVKLNQLTSISGGGGGRSGTSTPSKDMACYKCGEKGHMKANCPNR